jgi:hypothetical protein
MDEIDTEPMFLKVFQFTKIRVSIEIKYDSRMVLIEILLLSVKNTVVIFFN